MEEDPGLASRAQPFALYPLRLGLTAVFLAHGWNKVVNFGPWVDFLASQGVPLAKTIGLAVLVVELVGAVALLFGVLTRITSAVLTVVLLNAIYIARLGQGFIGGWELDLAVIAGLVTLFVNGPGRPTIWSALDTDEGLWPQVKARLGTLGT